MRVMTWLRVTESSKEVLKAEQKDLLADVLQTVGRRIAHILVLKVVLSIQWMFRPSGQGNLRGR